ncbi:MAG TPA: osmotically inducible protein OsmC [Sedimenticola sp.]|nr:osmotically inducible protein OsmC [Sedimenticola sp.]
MTEQNPFQISTPVIAEPPPEIIEVTFPGGKRVDARVGQFLIETDQSKKGGGEASAPEPFDLFLASIATCAGIFALGFCQSRSLSTEGMALKLICERDPKKKLFGRMTFQLTLPRGFPDKYRGGITRSMELCTVKKHMMDAPAFDIELQAPPP